MEFDGEKYVQVDNSKPKQGQRPIVVFIQAGSDDISTQFVEFQGEIVGANIIASEKSSVSGLLTAIGSASSVILNSAANNIFALPSASFVKDGKSYVVLNADEAVVHAAVSAGAILHGHHFSALSSQGVAAVLNGAAVAKTGALVGSPDSHSFKVTKGALIGLQPDNLTFPASKLIFFDKKGVASELTKEKAATQLVEEVGTNKEVVIKQFLENISLGTIKSPSELPALLV
jgi:hypothetical protein